MASPFVSSQSAMATIPPPAAAEEQASERPEDTSKRCVLIVEDVGDQRRTLALILEREGFEILACGSGEEGLEVAREHDIAVAVLDYKLPNLAGIEILQQSKATADRTPGTLHSA